MLLGEYRETDANVILNWINSERGFRLWSADRYKSYPVTSEDINNNYQECMKSGDFYPLTLEDDGKIIGHLILRDPDGSNSVLRLGFVIVDASIRGKGYGKKLLQETIKYAQDKFDIHRFSLGVFTVNESALKCYQSVGFRIIDTVKDSYKFYDESWDCAELVLREII